MKLINLTPHGVTFLGADDAPAFTIKSSGNARCADTSTAAGRVFIHTSNEGVSFVESEDVNFVGGWEVPVTAKGFGPVTVDGEPFPAQNPGTGYIVSLPVAQALWAQGREDVFTVGDVVRSPDRATVIGCKGINCNPSRSK